MSSQRSSAAKSQSKPPSILTQSETSRSSRNLTKTSTKVSARGKGRLSKSGSRKPDFRNRNQEALRRLGLKADSLEGVPIITHILKESEGGLPEVIECLRGCDDPIAQSFIEKYDSVAKSDLSNGRIRIEHVCVAAEIDTPDLLAIATKAIFNAKKVTSALKLASAHPKLVAKSIQMGLQDKGVRDREMMHSAIGFLPQSQNTTNFFKIKVQHLTPGSQEKEIEMPVSEDLPAMDDDIIGLHEVTQKLLTGESVESPKVDEWSDQ